MQVYPNVLYHYSIYVPIVLASALVSLEVDAVAFFESALSDRRLVQVFNVTMRAYEYDPASETKLTSPSGALLVIKTLNIGKTPEQGPETSSKLRYNLSHERV